MNEWEVDIIQTINQYIIEHTTAIGIPPDGADGQILAKAGPTNYITEWIDPPSGGGTEIDDGAGTWVDVDFITGVISNRANLATGNIWTLMNASDVEIVQIDHNGNIITESGQDRIFGNKDDYNLGFLTNNLNRLHIQNDGLIGIGTTSPLALLHINGIPGATLDQGIAFGDGDTGIHEGNDDFLRIMIAGTDRYVFGTAFMGTTAGAGGAFTILGGNLTTPTPSILPYRSDTNTGFAGNNNDAIGVIAGGIEAVRYTEVSGHVIQKIETDVGITASTTQSQGQQPLLSSYNEISTVGNTNDVVTLPAANKGIKVTIINNGANTLQIFPASGDDLGSGVDTSTTLASGSTITYFGYNTTNWKNI